MKTEQNTLALKAVACARWKWCYGMLALFPAKPKDTPNIAGYKVRITDGTDCRDAAMEGALPDLADAATIGCLYALVREEWQDPFLIFRGYPSTDSLPEMWRRLHQGNRIMAGAESHSEAEALVAALEDAASQPDKGATP